MLFLVIFLGGTDPLTTSYNSNLAHGIRDRKDFIFHSSCCLSGPDSDILFNFDFTDEAASLNFCHYLLL